MKIPISIILITQVVIVSKLLGTTSLSKMSDVQEKKPFIYIENEPVLEIHEGYVSQKKETVLVKQRTKTVAKVHLFEPVIVAQAEDEMPWGYFQFPKIYRGEKGNLIVAWSMQQDSHKTYGKGRPTQLMSKDEGLTWEPLKDDYVFTDRYGVELNDSEVLQVKIPVSKDIRVYRHFPAPVSCRSIKGYKFYHENELPDELRGVYFKLWDKRERKAIELHGNLNDSTLLRYAIDDLMPIVWWGDIKNLGNKKLVAGVYGGFYQGSDGNVLRSTVSFYKSIDDGRNWNLLSVIPFTNGEYKQNVIFDGYEGFNEPAFEVLNDGTYICIMRSGAVNPMYLTKSKDCGLHWSIPKPLAPNGVFPSILKLDNGCLVLASGRPGVQLRFNIDGSGEKWTDPIDMVYYMNRGSYDIYASCGYSCLLGVDRNTFYIVYSDFKKKNHEGITRKAIMFRKVELIVK